jgi:hypothetical protein
MAAECDRAFLAELDTLALSGKLFCNMMRKSYVKE